MNQPTRRIEYSRFTHDYSCFLDEQYVGSRPTQIDAEILIDRVIADRAEAISPALRLAYLHTEYGKARAEGRTADAKAIKAEAAQLTTTTPVEYSAFAAAQAELMQKAA